MKIIFTISGENHSSEFINDKNYIDSSGLLKEYTQFLIEEGEKEETFYIPINYECDPEILQNYNHKILQYMLSEYLLIEEKVFYSIISKILYSLKLGSYSLIKVASLLPDNDVRERLLYIGERYISITKDEPLPCRKVSSLLTLEIIKLCSLMNDLAGVILRKLHKEGIFKNTETMKSVPLIFELIKVLNENKECRKNKIFADILDKLIFRSVDNTFLLLGSEFNIYINGCTTLCSHSYCFPLRIISEIIIKFIKEKFMCKFHFKDKNIYTFVKIHEGKAIFDEKEILIKEILDLLRSKNYEEQGKAYLYF